jgi:hypothetical protein
VVTAVHGAAIAGHRMGADRCITVAAARIRHGATATRPPRDNRDPRGGLRLSQPLGYLMKLVFPFVSRTIQFDLVEVDDMAWI